MRTLPVVLSVSEFYTFSLPPTQTKLEDQELDSKQELPDKLFDDDEYVSLLVWAPAGIDTTLRERGGGCLQECCDGLQFRGSISGSG